MPDIYGELQVVSGLAVGIPIGWLLRSLFRDTPREAGEPEEFQPSNAWNLEALPLVPAYPVGVGRRVEPEKPYSVGRDEKIITPLLRLILNEYSGGDAIPRTGIPLTWRVCSKWGMKRAGWVALCEYVFPGRGYLAPGPGGKLVTVLAAARARDFVKRARKAGRVGTPPLEGAVSLDLGDAT